MSIQDRLWENFDRYATRTAVSDEKRNLTYREIGSASSRIALKIASLNLRNECIGISVTDGINHIVAMIGVLLSGNYYLSVTKENRFYFQDGMIMPIKLILHEDEKDPVPGNYPLMDIFDDQSGSCSSGNVESLPIHSSETDQNFCAFLTSGTTKDIKAVIHTHRNIEEDTFRQIEENQINEMDKVDFVFSFAFSASLACIFPTLLSGAELCIFDLQTQGIDHLVSYWEEKEITFSTLSASSFRTLCNLSDSFKHLRALRFISIGAEPVIEKDIRLFFEKFPAHTVLQVAYATTETRTISEFKTGMEHGMAVYPFSLGKPVRNKNVRIISDQGDESKPHNIGEIVVESEFIAGSYSNNPGETEKSFKKHGKKILFFTGDLGFKNEHDYLFYAGRKAHQVKINGQKINLGLIESSIRSNNEVSKAVVVINDSITERSVLVAFIQPGDPSVIDRIRSVMKDHLPSSHLPSFYVTMDDFPMTHTGKIDRGKLEKFPLGNYLETKELSTRPQELAPLEETILRIWNQVLKITHSGPDSDYFHDLGGDSLNAIICTRQIEKELHIRLPENALLLYRTAGKLAEYLRSGITPGLVTHSRITPYLAGRKNLYFISHTSLEKPFEHLLQTNLSSAFNISFLVYDMNRASQLEKGALDVIEKMKEIISKEEEIVLAGFSFNGFLVHQLAALTSRIRCCILLDTPNYFDYEPYHYRGRYGFYSSVLKTSLFESDYGLAWKLVMEKAKILNGIIKNKFPQTNLAQTLPNGDKQDNINLINYFIGYLKNETAETNCLFIKTTRAYKVNFNHGYNWKKHFQGKFRILVIKGVHNDIFKQQNAQDIADFIISGH